jgi:hypothetical protein
MLEFRIIPGVYVLGSFEPSLVLSGNKIRWRQTVVAHSSDWLSASRAILAGICFPPIPWPMTDSYVHTCWHVGNRYFRHKHVSRLDLFLTSNDVMLPTCHTTYWQHVALTQMSVIWTLILIHTHKNTFQAKLPSTMEHPTLPLSW